MLRFITRTGMIAALALTVTQTSFGQDRFLSNQEIEHTVVKGQTLYSIARGYQLKAEDLGIDNAIRPVVINRPKQSVNKQDMLYQKYLADKEGRASQTVKGAANWFKTENRMMASNYYGMLSNVPVGSIVEVINPQNGKKVYVKIIGGLPNTAENNGATIKLTPVAQTALHAGDAKLQVTVNYYK